MGAVSKGELSARCAGCLPRGVASDVQLTVVVHPAFIWLSHWQFNLQLKRASHRRPAARAYDKQEDQHPAREAGPSSLTLGRLDACLSLRLASACL